MERASTHPDADGESNAARDQVVRKWILSPASLLTAALVLATLCSLLFDGAWFSDLAVHFRLQYAALALIAFVAFALARAPVWAAVALGIALTNGLIAAPLLVSRPAAATAVAADGVPVRLVFINVYFGNDEYRRVLDFVAREKPDALILGEINERWRGDLGVLKKDYPHQFQTQGRRGRGLWLLSRLPIADAAAIGPNEAEPAFRVTLDVHGNPLHVIGVHTNWPFGFRARTSRDEELAEIAVAAQATARPLVVLGDLNVSPFSMHFRNLLRVGKLDSAAAGFGWQPTWPQYLPIAGIQIDHVLVSAGVQVREFRRGAQVGSDHLPVIVDLAL